MQFIKSKNAQLKPNEMIIINNKIAKKFLSNLQVNKNISK